MIRSLFRPLRIFYIFRPGHIRCGNLAFDQIKSDCGLSLAVQRLIESESDGTEPASFITHSFKLASGTTALRYAATCDTGQVCLTVNYYESRPSILRKSPRFCRIDDRRLTAGAHLSLNVRHILNDPQALARIFQYAVLRHLE